MGVVGVVEAEVESGLKELARIGSSVLGEACHLAAKLWPAVCCYRSGYACVAFYFCCILYCKCCIVLSFRIFLVFLLCSSFY